MAILRKRIKGREQGANEHAGWYEGLINWSPWLTTLLSALAWPFMILFLLLTLGPCLMDRLMTLVCDWVNCAQLMVLKFTIALLETLDSQDS